ncbi:MAG: Yip1 family protein [Bacteroidales bacterium]|jgi:hypothetical protein|nr:Yip1 family protein [Bacteroidales bacterium]
MNGRNIVTRIRSFIFSPQQTWEEVAKEHTTNQALMFSYYLPVTFFSSLLIFTGRILNWEDHSMMNGALAIIAYLLVSLLTIYLSAFILNELLPKFGTPKKLGQSFKLVLYASLPALIAYGISSFHPHLGFINYLALYSIVLFWKGIKPLLSVPAEKITGFALISMLILGALLILLSSLIMYFIIYFSVY